MCELRIGKLQPTKRLKNEGSLWIPSKEGRPLVVGDMTEWDGKMWKVFAISPGGLLTLQKINPDQVPASVVLTQSQARMLRPLIKIIKT